MEYHFSAVLYEDAGKDVSNLTTSFPDWNQKCLNRSKEASLLIAEMLQRPVFLQLQYPEYAGVWLYFLKRRLKGCEDN